jgi:hypothetical protein
MLGEPKTRREARELWTVVVPTGHITVRTSGWYSTLRPAPHAPARPARSGPPRTFTPAPHPPARLRQGLRGGRSEIAEEVRREVGEEVKRDVNGEIFGR